jgi:aspartyl protease family protein
LSAAAAARSAAAGQGAHIRVSGKAAMLGRVAFAATVMVLAVLALPQLLRGLVPHTGAPAPRAAAATAARAPQATPGRVMLDAGADGHYRTGVFVDGRQLDVLVDTGATMVTLRNEDARELGLLDAGRGTAVAVHTANGTMQAQRVELARLRIGDITLDHVAALVAPPGALSENLLGMSVLGRLRRFGVDDGRLVLEN